MEESQSLTDSPIKNKLEVTNSIKCSYLETEEELEMRPGITERRVGGGE